MHKKYLDFYTSGIAKEGELSVDPFYYILWSPEEQPVFNTEYEVDKYADNFVAFAQSGGGELLAYAKDGQIYTLPAIGLSNDEAVFVAKDYTQFAKLIET